MSVFFLQVKDQSIIVLYFNYEQEMKGFYMFLVGMFQEDSRIFLVLYENIDLLVFVYVVFIFRIGLIEEIVYEMWKEIWIWDKCYLCIFIGDFEMYD